MRRPATLMLVAVLALAAWSPAAFAGFPAGIPQSLAGASGRATAAELKTAQASVDAALKVRKQRFEGWQKAARAREAGAADVANKKRAGVSGGPLEGALKSALALDEEAARARSSLLAAEAEVARGGAALLKIYDALLVERRRVVEALPAQSAARAQAASAYKDLSTQRDAVRGALLPVLGERGERGDQGELPRVDLDARADDDVETLLEKADLARDLEARFLRQADAVRKRIAELEEEQAVAREVSGMVGRSQLFDEEDRRVLVLRAEATPSNSPPPTARSSVNGPQSGSDDVSFDGAPEVEGVGAAPPPPSFAVSAPSNNLVSSGTTSPPTLPRSEQIVGLVQTDAAMSGLLTSSGASVDALRALEMKLKAQAGALRDKSKKLKSEAKSRAQ